MLPDRSDLVESTNPITQKIIEYAKYSMHKHNHSNAYVMFEAAASCCVFKCLCYVLQLQLQRQLNINLQFARLKEMPTESGQ